MDLALVFENWDFFLTGVINTVLLVAIALAIGFVLSVPLSLARAYRHPVWNPIVWAYTYFFRGTPLLVQLYLLYYGLSQFEAVRDSVFWVVLKDAWWCALIAFVLNTTAYTTEIFRGAIEATPWGEVEAAKAAGMAPWTRVRRIIMPSALRRALPAYGNEVIFMLHGSVVASTITVIDILGAGRVVNAKYYVTWEGFISAAVLYGVLVFGITRIFKALERRYHAHLRPRETAPAKTPAPQPAA
ncbi:MAG: ABC transporter permease subunit [Marivibrio sp.]|uniref:ABC transporter permease n=1 Tax=Marivibrio sp. TaxID=2039719 RepID=UPI0032ED39E1